jgi:parallel beta-helix repeat protein
MEPKRHHKMLPALFLLAALTFAAIVIILAPAAGGATIIVPDDYASIQGAIDNATENDTIRVHAGTYNESILVNKTVEIIGNGTGNTTIIGTAREVVEVTADNVNISKLHIQGGRIAALTIRTDNCVFEDIWCNGSNRGARTSGSDHTYIGNSTFSGNNNFGLILATSTNITIYGCNISGNVGDSGLLINSNQQNVTVSQSLFDSNGGFGIEAASSPDLMIDNCTITNNSLDGAYLDTINRLQFIDNVVMYNVDFGTTITLSKDVLVTDNEFSHNGWGVYIDRCDNAEIDGNIANFNDGLGIGLFDTAGSTPVFVHHNHIEGNAYVLGGQESGLNVAGFAVSRGAYIEDNEIINNSKGIVLMFTGTRDNTFRRNLIKDNPVAIQNFNGARTNLFYHNNFYNNQVLVLAPHATDMFDNGFPTGGNFWDTYSGVDKHTGMAQDQPGSDGLGDSPFSLGTSTQDGYPLMRAFEDNPLAAIAIVHPDDGAMLEGTVIAEAVVTGDYVSMVEWYLDDTLVGRDHTEPYQLILDTDALVEDSTYALKATALIRLSSPISDTVSVTVNNMAAAGLPIDVSTVAASYSPDDRVTAIVAIQGIATFDQGEITAFFNDTAGTVIYLPTMVTTTFGSYGFTFWLPSDIAVGDVTLWVTAKAYQQGSHIWTSSNSTTFEVEGTSQNEQLAALMTQLGTVLDEIDGLNATNQVQLASALSEILLEFDNLDDAMAIRLGELEGAIADNASAMGDLLALQTEAIQMYIDDMNASVTDQLAAIDQAIMDIVGNATTSLDDIAAYLQEMEANGSTRHGEVMDSLDETYTLLEDVNTNTLGDLQANLEQLAEDLGGLNFTEADRHATTVSALAMEVGGMNMSVQQQLAALAKLDDIQAQLDKIANEVADINEEGTGGADSTINLLILVFAVITILLVLLIYMRVKDMGSAPPPGPAKREDDVMAPAMAPKVAPVPEPEPEEPSEGSFELMMEEPVMYPETEGPIMLEPEIPPEPTKEVPPPTGPPELYAPPKQKVVEPEVPPTPPMYPEEVPPEIPMEVSPEEPPEMPPDMPLEVSPEVPPEPSVEEPPEVPPEVPPEPPVEEPPEVPPPPPYPEPEVPVEEAVEIEVLEEMPAPEVEEPPVVPPIPMEFTGEPPTTVTPEEPPVEPSPEPAPEPEPELEPEPEPEPELEPEPEPEPEPAEGESDTEPPDEDEGPGEDEDEDGSKPREKGQSAQDWVLEEIMGEI